MKLLDDLVDDDEASIQVEDEKHQAKPAPVEPITENISFSEGTASRGDIQTSEFAEQATAHSIQSDDATMRLSQSKVAPHTAVQRAENKPTSEEVKASVGRYSPMRSGGFNTATDAALATSENLRIAQQRILELEQEIERLRTENEQLGAAGETLRRRADEVSAEKASLEGRHQTVLEAKEQEIEMLRKSAAQKEKEYANSRSKIEELEMRLSSNIQKIRVRERELENRLELVKMESTALVRSKDELILDLKRQVDQLNLELENYRTKGQELHKQLGDKQEMLRRTVKALRIALSMLEGEDESTGAASAQKKVK